MLRFGIDLGGTKIEGAILDASGAVVFRERISTERQHGYEHVVARIATMYASMVKAVDGARHTLGMGTPGSQSPRSGLMRNSNSVQLIGHRLREDVERTIGHALAIENDANCFAMAEALHGAARGRNVVFGVIMGTGCGGGLVLDGVVRTGRTGIAGEWGHQSIDPFGPLCNCGRRGCVETFISGSGLERQYQRVTRTHKSALEIVASAAGAPSDAAAQAVMAWFYEHFGRAFANLINVLDPDAIVIGGGLSNIDALYTRGVDEIAKRVFSDYFDTPVLRNELGDSAGVIGAALIGRE
jgi:fructokinase